MLKVDTFSAGETEELGFRLGRLLRGGELICLDGGLGTGKTVFVKGIARGLGVRGYVTSPTFTLVNEYEGRVPLYHFDVYRLASPEEMFEIGFEEYLGSRGVVVIEWADAVNSVLPRERIAVRLRKDAAKGEQARSLAVDWIGERYGEYEKELTV